MPFEQPQSIRTVFFDAGFTLIRPYPSTPEICQQVCQRLHLHIHLDTVKERMTEAQDYYYRQMRLNRHTWGSEHAISEFWISYYMNLLRPFIEEHDEPRLYQLAKVINQEFEKHTSWEVYPDVFPTLEVLRSQPGRVFSRSELVALVMRGTVVLERTIDVHIKALRQIKMLTREIGASWIRSCRPKITDRRSSLSNTKRSFSNAK